MQRIDTINDTLLITDQHEVKMHKIINKLSDIKYNKRNIITISGLSGSGKSEITHLLREYFLSIDVRCVVLHLDEYYHTHPDERRKRRELTDNIGYTELNWNKLDNFIICFKGGIDNMSKRKYDKYLKQYVLMMLPIPKECVLIVEGLYAHKIQDVDYKFFLESTYEESIAYRKLRSKEDVNCEFRNYVLEKEKESIESLFNVSKNIIKI